jgi:hypothetical protein
MECVVDGMCGWTVWMAYVDGICGWNVSKMECLDGMCGWHTWMASVDGMCGWNELPQALQSLDLESLSAAAVNFTRYLLLPPRC